MSKPQYDDVNVANTSKKGKMNLDNLENVIRYSLMPSLQHISAVNIMIALWSQADFQHQLAYVFYECGYDIDSLDMGWLEMRHKIGVKVLDRVAQLPVPNLIKTIFSNIVGPIGQEIYNWMRVNESFISSSDHYCSGDSFTPWLMYQKPIAMDYLVWTSRGRIDYKRTAKNLLDHMQLSNDDQFDLACTYCLEDDIAIIAPKVIDTLVNDLQQDAMMYFWTSSITGDFTELDKEGTSYNIRNRTDFTTNECIINCLLYDTRSETAIKYIWDKLNHEEKSRQCIPVLTRFSSVDLRCFILSQLNEEQQQGVFKACASKILLSLSGDWLWGTYFSPTLHHIWNVMTEGHYLDVLEGIVNKMAESDRYIVKYDSYRAAFKESWRSAPAHLKQFVFEHENGFRCHQMFFLLFCEKNVDILQSILFDCDSAQKQKIIFSESCRYRCYNRINGQYGLLETLIEYTLVSEGDGGRCEQKFVKESGEFISYFMANKKWNEEEQSKRWHFNPDKDRKQFCDAISSGICRDGIKANVLRYKGGCTQLEHLSNW